MSTCPYLAPAEHKQALAETTVDPANMWLDSNTSPNNSKSKAQKHKREGIQACSANEADMKAEEKELRPREINKVAAAKCRQRRRRQVETIKAKSGRLSKTNAQLNPAFKNSDRSSMSCARAESALFPVALVGMDHTSLCQMIL
jgi:hypothetical protein